MNIIRAIDKKLTAWTFLQYQKLNTKPKIHSIVGAVFITYIAILTYPNPFAKISLFLVLFGWLFTLYELNLRYRLKRKDSNCVGNLFFRESTTTGRKFIFFTALAIWISQGILINGDTERDLLIYSRIVYVISYRILSNIPFAIISVELWRTLSPSGSSWNNRRALILIVVIIMIMTAINLFPIFILRQPMKSVID